MAKQIPSQNPLIDSMPDDTINKVCGVLAYLQWVESGEFSCDAGNAATLGKMMILKTCEEAVKSLSPTRPILACQTCRHSASRGFTLALK